MIEYGHGIVGYILTCLSLMFALFTSIVSFIIVFVILSHLYHYRRQLKREEKITLILSSHIYSFILIFTITLLSMNIQTVIADVYGNNFYSSWCIFRGYWLSISALTMYYEFVVQALYRLFRIVYPNYRWLQSYWIFVISAPVLYIIGSSLLCPLLFWHDFVYLPQEHYCLITYTNIDGMIWLMFATYIVPFTSLLIIQIRITVFLRRQSSNLALAIKQKQQRDLVVIRRIFINIGLLLATGMPATIISLMAMFSDGQYSLAQRITFFTVGISFATLSIEMIIITPQLKRLIIERYQQNRVMTIEGMMQMQTIGTTT